MLLYFRSKHTLNLKIIVLARYLFPSLFATSITNLLSQSWMIQGIRIHACDVFMQVSPIFKFGTKIHYRNFALHSSFAILWKLFKTIYSCEQSIWEHFPFSLTVSFFFTTFCDMKMVNFIMFCHNQAPTNHEAINWISKTTINLAYNSPKKPSDNRWMVADNNVQNYATNEKKVRVELQIWW